jgi:acetyl-CoA C-acetyltransferase
MNAAVILAACRTAIGRFQGQLAGFTAPELGVAVIRGLLERSGLTADQVEEVFLGNVLTAGVGQAPARQAAILAGLSNGVSAVTINQVCGSGLRAVMLADQAIRCGDTQVIVAGGMECMSRAPWLIERRQSGIGDRVLIDSMIHDGLRCGTSRMAMGEIADRLATQQSVSRVDQDQVAQQSHQRAIEARSAGLFRNEIVSLRAAVKSGDQIIDMDEGMRADCTEESLSRLRPAFTADGTVTAGNSSMISDGAAALLVASADYAKAHGIQPQMEIVASAASGLAPEDLFVAPVEAIRKLLAKTGCTVPDVDLWEINEAFAVQLLACQRSLEIPFERLNVHGGAIALGHPIGASGARVLTTLLHALQSRNAELGVAALCLGGGNAVAMMIRRLA